MGEAVDTIPTKKLRGWVGMGEAVDTIPSLLNKCIFVSPDGLTDDVRWTDDYGRQSRGIL